MLLLQIGATCYVTLHPVASGRLKSAETGYAVCGECTARLQYSAGDSCARVVDGTSSRENVSEQLLVNSFIMEKV